MVQTQAVYLALGQKVKNKTMGGIEYCWLFDTHAREVIDIEEAAVVDLVGGNAPVRKPIALKLDQIVQLVETDGISSAAVEFGQIVGDVTDDVGTAFAHDGKIAFVHVLVALALGHGRRRSICTRRQTRKCGKQSLQFHKLHVAFAQNVGKPFTLVSDDGRIGRRVDRQAVLMVKDAELATHSVKIQA